MQARNHDKIDRVWSKSKYSTWSVLYQVQRICPSVFIDYKDVRSLQEICHWFILNSLYCIFVISISNVSIMLRALLTLSNQNLTVKHRLNSCDSDFLKWIVNRIFWPLSEVCSTAQKVSLTCKVYVETILLVFVNYFWISIPGTVEQKHFLNIFSLV